MRRSLILATALSILSAQANASVDPDLRATAASLAVEMARNFGCIKECLTKTIHLGYGEKYPHGEMRVVAGVFAAFTGACRWDKKDCESVIIDKNPTGDPRKARYEGPNGSRALRLTGFRDTAHQVRFLTRMALIAEMMGLKPNIGLGLVRAAGDELDLGNLVTHFDVNGHEVDVQKKCTSVRVCEKGKKCTRTERCEAARVWGYGYRSPLQILLQSKIRTGTIPEIFASYFLGHPPAEFLATEKGTVGIIDTMDALTTFYGPGGPSKMEGQWETSMPNLEGAVNDRGDPIPRTLDDVRLGRTRYVTLASDPSNYGLFVHLGAVTYTSPIDKKTYTGDRRQVGIKDAIFSPEMEHVFGYVHDTGGAFQGRPDKFDVCVGDFRTWSGRDAERFATQAYGGNIVHRWLMVRGLPTKPKN